MAIVEVVLDLVLADELAQPLRAQLEFERRVVVERNGRDDAIRIFFGQRHAGR